MNRARNVGALILAILLTATGIASAQTTEDTKFQTYIDQLKKDVRAGRQSLVDQAMGLEAAQKAQFWKIYEGYQAELNTIWDQRVANAKKYADSIDSMTDATADQLAVKMMDIESQRTALKKKYYSVYKEKMGARVAARFVQVESAIGAFADLQIGSEVPIIQ